MDRASNAAPVLALDYLNHRGERATRRVTPKRVWYGTTEWHENQWLLECFDHERGAIRNYALSEIQHWDSSDSLLPTGVYRHFKGGLYLILGTLRDSESEDVLVRYRKLYDDFGEWVRPLDMFTETVEHDGVKSPRFEIVVS